MSYEEYNEMMHAKQKSVDIIQREATKLNAMGEDVTDTFDNMRTINRELPKLRPLNIRMAEFSEETKEERNASKDI